MKIKELTMQQCACSKQILYLVILGIIRGDEYNHEAAPWQLFNPAVAGVFRHPQLAEGGGALSAPTS